MSVWSFSPLSKPATRSETRQKEMPKILASFTFVTNYTLNQGLLSILICWLWGPSQEERHSFAQWPTIATWVVYALLFISAISVSVKKHQCKLVKQHISRPIRDIRFKAKRALCSLVWSNILILSFFRPWAHISLTRLHPLWTHSVDVGTGLETPETLDFRLISWTERDHCRECRHSFRCVCPGIVR